MKTQFELGAPDIEQFEFDPKSRDDIPKLLRGLQLIHQDEELLKDVLSVLSYKPASAGRVGPGA